MTPAIDDPHPANLTAGDVLRLGRSLSVHCRTCGVLRDPDLPRLAAARPTQRLAEMTFRCRTCGQPGSPLLTWRGPANEWRRFDYAGPERKTPPGGA